MKHAEPAPTLTKVDKRHVSFQPVATILSRFGSTLSKRKRKEKLGPERGGPALTGTEFAAVATQGMAPMTPFQRPAPFRRDGGDQQPPLPS